MREIVLELVSTSNLAEINPLWNLFTIYQYQFCSDLNYCPEKK